MTETDTVMVRYIVHDVDTALAFYTTHLGFEVLMHPAPGFAMLARGALRLRPSAPGGPGRRGPGHARWARTGTRRLEPDLAAGHRSRQRGRPPAHGRPAFPQRHRRRR